MSVVRNVRSVLHLLFPFVLPASPGVKRAGDRPGREGPLKAATRPSACICFVQSPLVAPKVATPYLSDVMYRTCCFPLSSLPFQVQRELATAQAEACESLHNLHLTRAERDRLAAQLEDLQRSQRAAAGETHGQAEVSG